MSGVRCNLLLIIRRNFFSLHFFFINIEKSPNFSKTLLIIRTRKRFIYMWLLSLFKKINIYLFSILYFKLLRINRDRYLWTYIYRKKLFLREVSKKATWSADIHFVNTTYCFIYYILHSCDTSARFMVSRHGYIYPCT